jgi:hypothetical protein
VFEFWNINSILRAMQAQDFPGISMCLIRDPMVFESYFVFAVRNGDTLTILTDREEHRAPRAGADVAPAGSDVEQRAERHWFPYELLDLKVSADGKHLYAAQRTSLVRTNVVGVPLKDVSELGPHEFIWAILVFDLIRERFWVQQKLLPEVSYTGEMIVEPQALVGAGSALVKSGQYKYLELPRLTAKDVTEETTAGQWEQDHAPQRLDGRAVRLEGARRLPQRRGRAAEAALGEARHEAAVAGAQGRQDRGTDGMGPRHRSRRAQQAHALEPGDGGTDVVRDEGEAGERSRVGRRDRTR